MSHTALVALVETLKERKYFGFTNPSVGPMCFAVADFQSVRNPCQVQMLRQPTQRHSKLWGLHQRVCKIHFEHDGSGLTSVINLNH